MSLWGRSLRKSERCPGVGVGCPRPRELELVLTGPVASHEVRERGLRVPDSGTTTWVTRGFASIWSFSIQGWGDEEGKDIAIKNVSRIIKYG